MPGESQFSSWTFARAARIRASAVCFVDPWQEFDSACEECFTLVRRYVRSRVHDPHAAEDLVGDIFERAVRNWHTFEHRSTPQAWILGIARHVIADYRRRSRYGPMSIEALGPGELLRNEESPEDESGRRDEIALLRRAVAELDDHEQDLLALRYVAGLPFREIGAVLGVHEGTVRVRMHRVMVRLRSALAEGGFGE